MVTVTYAECHIKALYAECCYAKCRYAECRYTEWRGTLSSTVSSSKVCTIKLFMVVIITGELSTRSKHFQPSLIFARKAGAYQISNLGVGSEPCP